MQMCYVKTATVPMRL